MMNFETYIETFNFSSVDKVIVNQPFYVALGMCGEVGEAMEKVRQSDTPGLLLELGDVAWYCCKMAQVLGVPVVPSIDLGQKRIHLCVADLVVQTAAIADIVKKTLRDDTVLDKKRVSGHLANALGLVAQAARLVGSSLPVVLQMNRDKLLSRQRRKVIHGSGDYR